MSRGLGPTQRQVLDILQQRAASGDAGWVHLHTLTEEVAAIRGVEPTEPLRKSVYRAMRTLWDRKLVDWPAYGTRSFRQTYYNRHSGQMQSVMFPREGGTRCRLAWTQEQLDARTRVSL